MSAKNQKLLEKNIQESLKFLPHSKDRFTKVAWSGDQTDQLFHDYVASISPSSNIKLFVTVMTLFIGRKLVDDDAINNALKTFKQVWDQCEANARKPTSEPTHRKFYLKSQQNVTIQEFCRTLDQRQKNDFANQTLNSKENFEFLHDIALHPDQYSSGLSKMLFSWMRKKMDGDFDLIGTQLPFMWRDDGQTTNAKYEAFLEKKKNEPSSENNKSRKVSIKI